MDNLEFEISERTQSMAYTFKPSTRFHRIVFSVICALILLILYCASAYPFESFMPPPIFFVFLAGVILFWIINIKQPHAIPNPWNESSSSPTIMRKINLTIVNNMLIEKVDANPEAAIEFSELKICRARGCYFFSSEAHTFILPYRIPGASDFVSVLQDQSGLVFFE